MDMTHALPKEYSVPGQQIEQRAAPKKNIIAIIPARGGSKGVPRKNIKLVGGKPLIAHAILDGKASNYISQVYVSTEDAEIKQVAVEWGAEVIDRPHDLAQDKSPTLPVMQHVVQTLEKRGQQVDLVVLLQATALYKSVEEIDQAIEIMLTGKYDSLISLSPTPKHFVKNWQKEINAEGLVMNHHDGLPINDDKSATRRQDLPTTYWKNGQLYIMTPETLMENDGLFGERCYGFVIDRGNIANIDSPEDMEYAEYLWGKKKFTPPPHS
jgi:CMP-N,N'-diacetyllegionaminic acid synthase